MKKTKKYEFPLRLPYDLHLKLVYIAKEKVGNTNGYIQLLVREAVEKYEREHGPIPGETEIE